MTQQSVRCYSGYDLPSVSEVAQQVEMMVQTRAAEISDAVGRRFRETGFFPPRPEQTVPRKANCASERVDNLEAKPLGRNNEVKRFKEVEQ